MPNNREKNASPKKGIGYGCTEFTHNTTGWGRFSQLFSSFFLSNSAMSGSTLGEVVEVFSTMFVCENTLLCWSFSLKFRISFWWDHFRVHIHSHNEYIHRNITGHFYLKYIIRHNYRLQGIYVRSSRSSTVEKKPVVCVWWQVWDVFCSAVKKQAVWWQVYHCAASCISYANF